MKDKKFKNVVVFTSGGIGDFVMATSAISLIKNYDKNVKVTLIVCKGYESLISKKLQVDEIITLNRKYHVVETPLFLRLIYKVLWIIKNWRKLYGKDICLMLEYSSFFIKVAKCFLSIRTVIDEVSMNKEYNHLTMKYQMLVRIVFQTQNLSIPMLPDTDNIKQKINSKFLQSTKKYKIALCTRTSIEIRNWDINYFNELIKKINKTYDVTFYIVGNSKEEIENGEYLIRENKNADIRNLCGKTSFLEVKELLMNMDLLVSVDTSIVHFAAIGNIPTISMYGFSLPSVFGPINHNSICLFTGEDCSPCIAKYFLNKMKCKYPKCMYNITPNMVFKEVRQILDA